MPLGDEEEREEEEDEQEQEEGPKGGGQREGGEGDKEEQKEEKECSFCPLVVLETFSCRQSNNCGNWSTQSDTSPSK